MPIQNESRNALRKALDRLQASKDALREAEQVSGRAAEDLKRASDAAGTFDGLDAQFAQARIDALKSGAWKGYPKALQAKRLERLAAQEEAQHAQHAIDILKAQEADSRADVTFAERELEEATAMVFCESVGDVVRQLNEANQRCESLRLVLRGACLPFDSPGWERLNAGQRATIMASAIRGAGLPAGTLQPWRDLASAAINAVHPPRTSGEATPEATSYWRSFAQELVQDPDAHPGPLPDLDAVLSAK